MVLASKLIWRFRHSKNIQYLSKLFAVAELPQLIKPNIRFQSPPTQHHSFYRNKPPYLNKNIFPQQWFASCVCFPSLGSCSYPSSSKSFIYSLYNINGYAPVKLQIKSGYYNSAIYRCSGYGPTFGGGNDIRISNNAGSNRNSYTSCGCTYPLPPGYSSSRFSCTFYAGSYKFTPTDVEVFYETTS